MMGNWFGFGVSGIKEVAICVYGNAALKNSEIS
jgi:hypothetical protein